MAHSVVMNSLLEGEGSAGEQAVIEHSHLEGAWSIGRASFVSQIHSFTDLAVADAIAVQEVAVGAGSCVLIATACTTPSRRSSTPRVPPSADNHGTSSSR